MWRFKKASAKIFTLLFLFVFLVSNQSAYALAKDSSGTTDSEIRKQLQEMKADAQENGIPTVDASLSVSPNSNWQVGKTIKITVTTPLKGTIEKEARLKFLAPIPFEEIEKVKTTKKKTTYVSTASFTPKTPDDYALMFTMTMKDDKGNLVQAVGGIKLSVKENKKITVSVSPNTASMKKGEDLYLVVTYPMKKDAKHSVKWNESLQEISSTYDTKTGSYKRVYLFQPEKAKRYSFTVTVLNEEKNVRSEGVGKTSITVK